MDIRVRIPLQSRLQKRVLDVDRNVFASDLKNFVDKLENEFILNEEPHAVFSGLYHNKHTHKDCK